MKKSLLLALLLFCITINAQESKFLIFPGCKKFERKGNKKLIDCYSSNFNKLLSNEVQ
ncbi:hypothetical protein [Faecalibacter rhinopitheci]|uniref:hypothetical protein n=1 Tax=Faecalibacter rhinopitheci TaxID=2779678 RepID=UPI001883CD27|nr:hypothetical protein [Faecalibacter rhinopitheci]